MKVVVKVRGATMVGVDVGIVVGGVTVTVEDSDGVSRHESKRVRVGVVNVRANGGNVCTVVRRTEVVTEN